VSETDLVGRSAAGAAVGRQETAGKDVMLARSESRDAAFVAQSRSPHIIET
jgi:hypothetical protein